MDDLSVFGNFLSTQCGLTVNCARDKPVVFLKIFTARISTSDADIDDFVKNKAHMLRIQLALQMGEF